MPRPDNLPAADAGTGKKKTLLNLDGGYFTGKKQGRLLLLQRDVLHDVEQEGGLPHRRTGRNDEHVPRLETVTLAVQLAKPGGKPLNLPLADNELFKAGDGFLDESGQPWAVRADPAPPPYLEQAGFRGVHQGLHILRAGKRVRDGPRRRVDDGTQNKLIPQCMQVMLEKGSGSSGRVQGCQPGIVPLRRPADAYLQGPASQK